MKKILTFGRQRVTKLLHLALCIYFIIFISACGEAIYSSSETGSIAFSLELQGAPNEISGPSQAINCGTSGISTVEAKVYDEDGALIASGGPWDCGAHSGTITSVPAGSNRKVVILGKDASGSVLYSGEEVGILVIAGQTTDVGTIILSRPNQVWHTSGDFPSDFITEKGDLGYRITSLAYGDGMWAVVMSEADYLQWWAIRFDFLAVEDFIYEKWDLGYRITGLAYGDGMWAVVMSQGTDYTDQVWNTSADFPSDFISEKWGLGYEITSLAYGDGMWAVVMSEADYLQAWATRLDFPSDFISEKWDLGYRITSLAYGDGMWAVVMSEADYLQAWATRLDFPSDYISEKWDEGYRITSLAYGDGMWAVVMSE